MTADNVSVGAPSPATATATETVEASHQAEQPRPAMAVADRIAIAEGTLSRLLEWIRAVDAKTPLVIAIATGMLGVIAAVAPKPGDLALRSSLAIALGAIPLIGSLVLCLMATFPQTRGPLDSLIFFGGIAKRSAQQFLDAERKRTQEEYLADLLAQCHRNAEIAASKYADLKRALYWLAASIPFWLWVIYDVSGQTNVAP